MSHAKAEPIFPKVKQVLTHVLVTDETKRELLALSNRTRRQQSVLLRDAVDALLRKYSGPERHDVPAQPENTPTDVSIVFRLKPTKLAGVHILARRTRIRQSELLREAIYDLLARAA